MTYQDYFNILGGIVTLLLTWWVNTVWKTLKDLSDSDEKLKEKHQKLELVVAKEYAQKSEVDALTLQLFKKLGKLEEIEILVASQYVTKDDFSKSMDALMLRLDKISEKLDRKADKP